MGSLCCGTSATMSAETAADYQQKLNEELSVSRSQRTSTIRVLLSGTASSGKTTIIKQMRKIHNKYNDDDAGSMKEYIQESCIQYMKILCFESQRLYLENCENTKIADILEPIRSEFISLQEPYGLTHDVIKNVKMLWMDNGIKNTLSLCRYYQIDDNVSYFLDKFDEISSSEYNPTFSDYIRIRYPSTGFIRYPQMVNVGIFKEHQFEFIDTGGRRSERRKWQKFILHSADIQDIDAMIYVVGISEYDMKLYEDDKTNRLKEGIELFTDIMSKSGHFQNKPVLLFFNKYDLFQEKIKKIPITVAFDDFDEKEKDPNNEDDVIQFIAAKFLRVFQENDILLKRPLHILRTTALDTNCIDKVFGDITAEILHEIEQKQEINP